MKYGGLEKAYSTDVPHLGGSIKLGDPFTYCPTVWDYVIARFGIEFEYWISVVAMETPVITFTEKD